MKKRIYIIGSVSHGTMRNTDLLESFSNVLEHLSTSNFDYIYEYQKYRDIIKESRRYKDFLIKHEDKLYKPHHEKTRAFILDTASCIIEKLIDALDEFAPQSHYFGAHPGDGADYGFWRKSCEK